MYAARLNGELVEIDMNVGITTVIAADIDELIFSVSIMVNVRVNVPRNA